MEPFIERGFQGRHGSLVCTIVTDTGFHISYLRVGCELFLQYPLNLQLLQPNHFPLSSLLSDGMCRMLFLVSPNEKS